MNTLTARSKTLFIQMFHSCLEGTVYGMLIMAEVIMRRELKASVFLITLFTMMGSVTNLLSIYFNHILTKYPGKIKTIITVAAMTTRLPMVLFFFFNTAEALFVLSALYYLGDTFIKPVQNIYMKMNYARTELGKIYAYSISLNKVFFIVAVYSFGLWMDSNSSVYIAVFSLCGIVSFLSFFMLGYVPVSEWMKEKVLERKVDLLIFPTLISVFRKNRRFLVYEAAFFIYGGGFMVVLAAVPILLVDHLNLSYSIISFGRGVVSAIVIIATIPLFGKLFDRKDPVFVGAMAFAILIAHPMLMIAAYFVPVEFAKWFIYLSYISFGAGMAAVTLCWNIGPMFFAKNNMEIPELTSTHVTLTGIRGLIWPVLGYFLMKLHIILPFIFSIGFFVSAVIIMRTVLEKSDQEN
ncbi:MAG TPA: MFS transporter [bacterium]|nr:MFS transporter [bacterium]